MSNSRNIQPGHYRTYRESGKTIEVNGGPKSKYNGGAVFDPFMCVIGIIIEVLCMVFMVIGHKGVRDGDVFTNFVLILIELFIIMLMGLSIRSLIKYFL
jgi:hypothetical protein